MILILVKYHMFIMWENLNLHEEDRVNKKVIAGTPLRGRSEVKLHFSPYYIVEP
jgi:hypothetical protein